MARILPFPPTPGDVWKWRRRYGIVNRDRGAMGESSGESMDWPQFRHDLSEIADRHSPINGATHRSTNHG